MSDIPAFEVDFIQARTIHENARAHVGLILLNVDGKAGKSKTICKSIILKPPKTLRKDDVRKGSASGEGTSANHRYPFRNFDADNIFIAGKGIGFDFGNAFRNDGFVPVDVFTVGG